MWPDNPYNPYYNALKAVKLEMSDTGSYLDMMSSLFGVSGNTGLTGKAIQMKEKANAYYRIKKFEEAVKMYSQAIKEAFKDVKNTE